ncbi:helix-turn-helix domain-containing protein [Thomasclavelia sp.]|uniref:helix-turn-helix domain-containing protein n=1 Tax=Thomasclavelia sp. TaxID=3025757 RepID=UPI0025DA704D|nr:helix-turn-helix domain-containing protein [Thomasclavelia sp.]
MGFNYAKEKIKWDKWKEKEEELLNSLGVDQEIIKQLRDYDWEMFKTERRIRSRQTVFSNQLFNNISFYDKKEISTVEDLLDEIENEALLHYLSQTDKVTMNILLLKIKGFSTKEISQILNISHSVIYSRIHHLKEKLKKFHNDVQK